MTIKEVEEKVGIKKANIRYYEEMGLIRPARDQGNNYRVYSEEDVELLELKIPLDNYFADTLQIQQNDTILQLPQKLSAGTQWQIQTKFMLPEKDERRHMVIQIQPALVAQYADGTTSKWILYDSMTYEPDFSQWEVIHILYMRGVI